MLQMNIAFRVDCSTEIGTGHLMRCLTLAAALSNRAAHVSFISRGHQGNLNSMIIEQGFTLLELPVNQFNGEINTHDYTTWLGAPWGTDVEQVKALLAGQKIDILFVDHYGIDCQWEQAMRTACDKLVVIDDLANRSHDCDMLIDQTYGRNANAYKPYTDERVLCLLGAQYTMLRPEFKELRQTSLKSRPPLTYSRILVSMGGIDKDNVTAEVLNALEKCQLSKALELTVVLGINAPHLDEINKIAAKLPYQTKVLIGVKDMAQLMKESDFCIGAAGSSAWERCCLGLPTIMLVTADNQRTVANSLANEGAAILLTGEIKQAMIKLFEEAIDEQLMEAGKKASELVDGKGCERIVEKLKVESWLVN